MRTSMSLENLLGGFASYPPVLTTAEVAELLNLSVQEVRRMAREGRMPARRVGKAYRYFRDEIVDWLNRQSTNG